MRVQYTLDFEFYDNGFGEPIPLSLGMARLHPDYTVADTLYVEFEHNDKQVFGVEGNRTESQKWLCEHVRPYLTQGPTPRDTIRQQVEEFTSYGDSGRNFWANCGTWDWFLLIRLFGKLIEKPKTWPWYFSELQQEWNRLGKHRILRPAKPEDAHCALADAIWNAEWLKKMKDWKP